MRKTWSGAVDHKEPNSGEQLGTPTDFGPQPRLQSPNDGVLEEIYRYIDVCIYIHNQLFLFVYVYELDLSVMIYDVLIFVSYVNIWHLKIQLENIVEENPLNCSFAMLWPSTIPPATWHCPRSLAVRTMRSGAKWLKGSPPVATSLSWR